MASVTHGMHNTRTYVIWRAMKARCTNPNVDSFVRYGGSGVTVCAAWLASFQAFLGDMGEAPAGMSIDRFPNKTGNYEPGNCRWATWRQQNGNRVDNLVLELNGRSQCAVAWAREMGYEKSLIVERVRRGWSAERAILTPPRDNRAPRRCA